MKSPTEILANAGNHVKDRFLGGAWADLADIVMDGVEVTPVEPQSAAIYYFPEQPEDIVA